MGKTSQASHLSRSDLTLELSHKTVLKRPISHDLFTRHNELWISQEELIVESRIEHPFKATDSRMELPAGHVT